MSETKAQEQCPNKEQCKLPDNHPMKDHLCNVGNFPTVEVREVRT